MRTLMDADDLAGILKVSRRTVYNLVAARTVPGIVRIGRRLRFDGREVERWLAKQRQRPVLPASVDGGPMA